MNQSTHTWIALRAVALLEDEGCCPDLVKLLLPQAKAAAIGAWLPDQRDAKSGGSRTENHIFKLEPYDGRLKSRFVVRKKDLLQKIGRHRAISGFLEKDTTLDRAWWSRSY
jgi:hypothetical protein